VVVVVGAAVVVVVGAAVVVVVGAAVVVVVGAAVVVVGAAVVVVGALVVVVVVVVVVAKGCGGVANTGKFATSAFLVSKAVLAAVFLASSVPAATTSLTDVTKLTFDALTLLLLARASVTLAFVLSVKALFKSAAVGFMAVSVLSALFAEPVTIVTALKTLVELFLMALNVAKPEPAATSGFTLAGMAVTMPDATALTSALRVVTLLMVLAISNAMLEPTLVMAPCSTRPHTTGPDSKTVDRRGP